MLEKGGMSHSGHRVHGAIELQAAKEKSRPNQAGIARY